MINGTIYKFYGSTPAIFKLGTSNKYMLNIRFVNYKLLHNGSYHFSVNDGKIISVNKIYELDETFNEKIKSRHRDEFSYASFSEGEKQRIDLALVFTWRTIAKMKNCASTNLLLLDEVFDSSLDANGTDYVMNLINTLGDETNVFVISHKGDLLFDKFRSVIKFEKHQNFSRISV